MGSNFVRFAFIPARSGSKGLKDKNIKLLAGKPLIAYTIEAAIESGKFNKVIVSTDAKRYGEIAKRYGADVVYRDASLSDDSASTFMVVEDLLAKLNTQMDYFMLLQPTSPLRNCGHILEAIELFESRFENNDFLVSIKEAEFPSDLVKEVEDDLSLKHFSSDFGNYRRQQYKYYSPNGAIYIAKPDCYIQQHHFFGSRSTGYVMDKYSSVDIDDGLDFIIAEALFRKGWC